jgi:NADH-quinone oxidoreductase subunit L
MIGSLSLSGVFPLAGFWSKDEILLDSWRYNHAIWAIGVIVAALTPFYMFRSIFLTFFGDYKGGAPVDHDDEDSHFHGDPKHPHESPWVMAAPLLILAIPAIGAGWFAYDHIFSDFINGALPEVPHEGSSFEWGIAISSTVMALLGVFAAYAIYYKQWVSAKALHDGFGPIASLLEQKYLLDRLYEDFFVKTVFQRGWNRLLELNDRYVVDGIIDGSARVATDLSGRMRTVQNGQVQVYALGLAAGIVVIVVAVFAANPL